jgi:hypothetical protein
LEKINSCEETEAFEMFRQLEKDDVTGRAAYYAGRMISYNFKHRQEVWENEGAVEEELENGEKSLFFLSSQKGFSYGRVAYSYELYDHQKQFTALLQLAAAQNNPKAFWVLAGEISHTSLDGQVERRKLFRQGAIGGDVDCMVSLSRMLWAGLGGQRDLVEFVYWAGRSMSILLSSSKHARSFYFFRVLGETCASKKPDRALMYAFGKAFYFYVLDTPMWNQHASPTEQEYAERCLTYYCTTVEAQQFALRLFLHFFKHTLGPGGGDVGRTIAQMVWRERETEDGLVGRWF